MKFSSLIILAIVFISCQSTPVETSAVEPEVNLGENFSIKIGEETQVKGSDVTISFKDVSEDSRCPTSVDCVWAGNAKLSILAKGEDLEFNTVSDSQIISVDGYSIELVTLAPYPEEFGEISKNKYIATLIVTEE